MAPHRYWRIHFTGSTSGSDLLISLYEVELRATPGGLDQCTGGVAAASHADATAYRLFDDNPSSYWINGGPSVPNWVHYDFGAGNAVVVGELRLLPRSGVQAPQSFALLGSDDQVNWEEVASWSGVTDWISGVEKLFVPPRPQCAAQQVHPFALALATDRGQGYSLGVWCHAQGVSLFALHLERGGQQQWGMGETVRGLTQPFFTWVERVERHPFALQLAVGQGHLWQDRLSRHLRQPLHEQHQRGESHPWSLRHRLLAGHRHCFGATAGPVPKGRKQEYALLPRNPVTRLQVGRWGVPAPDALILSGLPALTLGVSGQGARPLPVSALKIRQGADHPFWMAELHLTSEADFVAMRLDDPFVLQVGEDRFTLLVDGKRVQRDGTGRVVPILYGISPTARHAWPRAAPVQENAWPEERTAREGVEWLLGEPVQWMLPDWRIPAGRLSVRDLSPLQVVQRIAEAAGGLVQTTAAGQLRVLARFPHAVPTWSVGVPDHVLTEVQSILTSVEELRSRVRVDRVVVRNGPVSGQAGEGRISLHPDRRPDGPNQGRSRFFPGETAHLVLLPGDAVERVQVVASTGQPLEPVPTRWQQTEEVLFVEGNRARLSQPVQDMVAFAWLGAGLGEPVLQGDGYTLVTPQAGTAVLRVTGMVEATAYAVEIPQSLGGQANFSVLVTAVGQDAGVGVLELAMQRGDARYPLREVVAPLLSSSEVLACRARTELDQGELLHSVELTVVHRSGLFPGQLVEVQDGGYGRAFRALLVGVSHEIDPKGWISRLNLLSG